jgi:hypothetical protein
MYMFLAPRRILPSAWRLESGAGPTSPAFHALWDVGHQSRVSFALIHIEL